MPEELAISGPYDGRPTHHSSLYFPDGDIILSVTKSGKNPPLLRLHRIMLSHFSPIFKDMLSIPSNSQVNVMYEGAPVVVMPDPHDDLVDLVQALYAPEALRIGKNDIVDPKTLRGMLALAKKYQIDSISTRIIARVEADWPITLDQHYTARKVFASKVEYLNSIHEWERVELEFPEPVSAIQFAKEFGLRSILPAAFYRLATSDPLADWEEYDFDELDTLSAQWKLLDKEDWVRYNRGKGVLIRRFERFALWRSVTKSCVQKDACAAAQRELSKLHLQKHGSASFAQQPEVLGCASDLREEVDRLDFCWRCREAATDTITSFSTTLWQELPLIFDLSDLTS